MVINAPHGYWSKFFNRGISFQRPRTSRHFRVHYSIDSGDTNAVSSYDGDKNGTPDYIDMVLDLLEYTWSYFEDTLDYYMPPPDSTAGGDSLYDVYIYKLKEGVYGYVQAEKLVGDNPLSPLKERYSATSFMALRNNYYDFKGTNERNLKVTIVHEFFHAVQNGYDVYQKAWLKEATATWMEDVIYDDINDNYQYLSDWFQEPYTPLDADYYESPGHWYGSWIFFRYLEEHVAGRDVINGIWERSIAYDSKNGNYSMHIIKEELFRHIVMKKATIILKCIFPETCGVIKVIKHILTDMRMITLSFHPIFFRLMESMKYRLLLPHLIQKRDFLF